MKMYDAMTTLQKIPIFVFFFENILCELVATYTHINRARNKTASSTNTFRFSEEREYKKQKKNKIVLHYRRRNVFNILKST